ncbi:hypothetical protein BSFP_060590 [Burkholderia stabilis]|uniref:Uncharacterized protein n=1 Tax=Burkholderia stabilis TaxID=95485 RepID=A0A1Y1BTS5_9BURK|nr:hypothetical protein BSFP_060590 [Burkholderia stabilis]
MLRHSKRGIANFDATGDERRVRASTRERM